MRNFFFGGRDSRAGASRRSRQVVLSCDTLEGRVTPAHFGGFNQALGHVASQVRALNASGGTGTTTGTGTTNTALTAAQQQLRTDVLAIESQSGTTVAQLAAIESAFQTLRTDGLAPSSQSALQSFENSLVTTNATTPGSLTNNSTLEGQFAALYTSSPTGTQATDLQNAYNALAAAVTNSNITSANITTINNDYAAVQSALGNTSSTATYPYFNLVTGGGRGGLGGLGGFGGGGCG